MHTLCCTREQGKDVLRGFLTFSPESFFSVIPIYSLYSVVTLLIVYVVAPPPLLLFAYAKLSMVRLLRQLPNPGQPCVGR